MHTEGTGGSYTRNSQGKMQLERLDYKKTEDDQKPRQKDTIMQRDIEPGDTLLSLSIKYNVPIAKLKRVNNLLADQGFFALKRIKIPVAPFSLLLPEDHEEERSQTGWLEENSGSSSTAASVLCSRVARESAMSPSGLVEVVVDELQPLMVARRMEDREGRCSNRVMFRGYIAAMVAGFVLFIIVISWKKQ